MIKYILFFQKINSIGSSTIFSMINFFGSLENAFNSSVSDFKKFGFNEIVIEDILKKRKIYDFEKELFLYNKYNIKFVSFFENNYPKILKNLQNPPIIIFYKGDLFYFEKSIAVVGSRDCTEYGVSVTNDFCDYFISQNITIVSGGALGIDSISHKKAISKNAKTISVMGCGLDFIYPQENKKLFEDILYNGGLLISEFPIGVAALPKHFVMRNRIISALSNAVFIVEAGIKSGTITTASFAISQNKNVFVVPGSIYSLYSQGTNKLIKDGAIFVTDPVEINEMVWGINENQKIKINNTKIIDISWMNKNEKDIYDSILYKPINIETISFKLNLSINFISSVLIMFEIKGLVMNLGSMNYVRIDK